MLYGKRFTLLTDNKPLSQILNPRKGLPAYSAMRMQHYAVFLQGFDFEIKFRKTENHGNADGFSRLPIKDNAIAKMDVLDVYALETVNMLPVNANDIQKETSKDADLSKIVKALEKGTDLKKLGLQNHEFTLSHGILLRKDRVVIPEALRVRILEELHSGHIGIVKMKGLGRNYVWWKGMDRDIENAVQSCKECTRFQNNPKPVPLHHWEPTIEPFQRIHIDFAGPFLGHNFLVCVDSHTKWPEVFVMNNITATCTIEKCREIFARFGIPQMLVTDNGRTFISQEFQEFIKANGINHKRTAPYHPATNGLAERFVQTLKQALRKTNLTKNNVEIHVQKFLFHYRITPSPELKQSPAEAMFGRKLRSRLDLIMPKELVIKEGSISKEGETRIFQVGDKLAAREYLDKNIKWRFGTVLRRVGKLHYLVKLENGKIWKRHIDQLRSCAKVTCNSEPRLDLDIFDGSPPNQEVTENNQVGERPEREVPNAESSSTAIQTPPERENKEQNAGAPAGLEQSPVGDKDKKRASKQASGPTPNTRPQRDRKKPCRYGDFLSPL